MNRILIAASIALCAPLGACGPVSVQSAGQVVEKGVIGANDLYTASSKAGEALVKMGVWGKASYKAADARAYAILLKVQAGQATIAELTAATTALAGGK